MSFSFCRSGCAATTEKDEPGYDTNGEEPNPQHAAEPAEKKAPARDGTENRKADGDRARARTEKTEPAEPSARTPAALDHAREHPADATQSRGRQSARRRPGNEGGHDASEPATDAVGTGNEDRTLGRRKRVGGDAERLRRSSTLLLRSLLIYVGRIEGSRRTDEYDCQLRKMAGFASVDGILLWELVR